MKAAVMRATNTPMEIEDIAISKPVGREVLVRVAAVGLCHSDLSAFNGTLPSLLPAVLGHEVAGVVEQVGPDAHRLRPGDRVIVSGHQKVRPGLVVAPHAAGVPAPGKPPAASKEAGKPASAAPAAKTPPPAK